jgi:hypothetical protein
MPARRAMRESAPFAARLSFRTEAVAQTPEALTGSVLTVGLKTPKVIRSAAACPAPPRRSQRLPRPPQRAPPRFSRTALCDSLDEKRKRLRGLPVRFYRGRFRSMRPSGLEPPWGNLPTRPSTLFSGCRCVRPRPDRPICTVFGRIGRIGRSGFCQRFVTVLRGLCHRCCGPGCSRATDERTTESGSAVRMAMVSRRNCDCVLGLVHESVA